ncbi:hypothetical protein MBLNU230_g0012t1 [Neophaeotheca triangularis]
MRGWLRLAGILLLQLVANVGAVETEIDQKDTQVCSGMYSKKSWGGAVDPFILTKFIPPKNLEGDPIVSLVVFEWQDRPLIGKAVPEDDPEEILNICDQASVEANYCPEEDLGAFILSDNATETSRSRIVNQAIHLNDPPPINYPIMTTGYYCVITYPFSNDDQKYRAVVEFRNAFGELPAAQIAKLPFYAAMTLVYAFMALAWAFFYYMNRHDILPVQNYITAIVVFLVLEMFMTWLFYDFQNRHGLNGGAKALLVVVSILSAARNSFSFFLLLIVCMGYGVVKPSLGKTMIWVRWLAITHFVFGVIYAVASLSVTPENAGPLVLLVVLPLAGTLTAFYVWTLNSLNVTMKDLMTRRQTIKASMYRKLWWCILGSIAVIFAFFFVNSWTFAGQSNEDFVPKHWPTRWFILDGWLNLVYLFDVAFVAWVWRPTANNRRFAMSDEIAQDDDGFEIASMRDSLDFEPDDVESNPSKTPQQQQPSISKFDSNTGDLSTSPPPGYSPATGSNSARDASPLPAPVPTKPAALPRESLEGETLFAVGEDRLSDEESGDEEERRGLTGGRR